MASDVYGAIADYLGTIHKTIIWPTLAQEASKDKKRWRPDRLGEFRRVLMKTYREVVVLFEPPGRRCTTNDDCEQDEECIGGECTVVGRVRAFSASCRTNDDCEQ